jgi:transcriptional regulator with PAS, ATPase and Fis domain
MSAVMQVKLLRVLQERRFRRVGALEELQADIRVIAATNQDLARAISDGRFREDLYYRINVLAIALPPLRRRAQDIPLLVEAFIAEFNEKYGRQVKAVDETAMMRLRDHAWPGNVRELRNIIERAVVGCSEELITPVSLPLGLAPAERREQGDSVLLPLGTTLEQGERELILRTLESVNNNKTRAAVILGTTPKTLHNKTRRWRLGKESS